MPSVCDLPTYWHNLSLWPQIYWFKKAYVPERLKVRKRLRHFVKKTFEIWCVTAKVLHLLRMISLCKLEQNPSTLVNEVVN